MGKLTELKKLKQAYLQVMFPQERETVPRLRFSGFTEPWEQRKLNDVADNVGTGRSTFSSGVSELPETPFAVLGSTSVIGYDSEFDHDGDFILTARVGANAGNLYRHTGKVKISDNTVYIQGNNLDFLFCLLEKFDLKSLSFGTGQPLIKASELKSLALHYPCEEEQSLIGNFFRTLDNTIAIYKQKLDELKQLKKAYMQVMFPQEGETVPRLRFAGFAEPWQRDKANKIFLPVSSKGFPELPILSATQSQGMVLRDEIGIDMKFNKENAIGYKRVLPGQFVIHLRSFQGGFAHSNIAGITSPAYTILDFADSSSQISLFWLEVLRSEKFIKSLELVTYGIRDGKSISFNDFSMLELAFPSKEEQTTIGNFFRTLDELIKLYS